MGKKYADKNTAKGNRGKAFIAGIVSFIVFYILFGYLFGKALQGFFGAKATVITYGFNFHYAGVVTLFASLLVAAIVIYYSLSNPKLNKVAAVDDRGLKYMKNGVDGTSRWQNLQETEEEFSVGSSRDTKTTIYGQIDDGGNTVVSYKPKEHGGEGNRNLLLIGSPGTGKSYCYVRTELMQTIRRGESFVCTDPKGELYDTLSKLCINKNYDLKVLNLSDLDYSNFWNCLMETIDPVTERIDSTRVSDFANIYMRNASSGTDDTFWYESGVNLLKAIIGYCSWQREQKICEQYASLYSKVSLTLSANDKMAKFDEIKQENIPFPEIEKMILDEAEKNKFNLDEIRKIIKTIKDTAPSYNMTEVFKTALEFNDIVDEFDQIPNWHPSKTNYTIYKTNDSEAVRTSALQGLQIKLQIFTDPKISRILSYNEIQIKDINKKKTAMFVIMNDKTNTTKPIASLFFSFFFKDAQDEYDRINKICKDKKIANPLLPVTVMLDEFFSVGVIGGDPDVFAKTMSICRSRKLNVSIIIQSYPQIAQLYGENNSNVIQTCCETTMFIGCNDPETAKYISEYCSGEATVFNESHREGVGVLNRDPDEFTSSTKKRYLLTIGEVREWKNAVLIIKRGCKPLKLLPFPWTEHPYNKDGYLEESSVYANLKPVRERLKNFQNEDDDYETIIKNMIKSLNSELMKKNEKENQENSENTTAAKAKPPTITVTDNSDQKSKMITPGSNSYRSSNKKTRETYKEMMASKQGPTYKATTDSSSLKEEIDEYNNIFKI